MLASVVVLFTVLGVVSAIDAVMHSRTEQGTIAWAISLVTIPYVAVPASWVLGRSRFNGYVAACRKNLQEVAGVTEESVASAARFRIPDMQVDPAAREYVLAEYYTVP